MLRRNETKLLIFTPNGPYCPAGDFYIDPFRKVEKALITHAHADHARWGMKQYLGQKDNLPILKKRISENIDFTGLEYGVTNRINGVSITFYPAGHIPGSAMILLEHLVERWCFSGDYKCENDGFSKELEIPKCHVFITESTFGLPVFNWQPQREVFDEMRLWIREQLQNGFSVLVFAYSLGKAQRILHHLQEFKEKTIVHRTIKEMNEALKLSGYPIDNYSDILPIDKKPILYVLPPAAGESNALNKIGPYKTMGVSGWMALRGKRRRDNYDKGFVMSDHADWKGILSTIKETGAEKVMVTHGYSGVMSKYLNEVGYESTDLRLAEFEDEGD